MQRYIHKLSGYLFVLVLGSQPVLAHHSLVGEFDTSQTVNVTGTLTKLEWFNPHVWLYFDVDSAQNGTEPWQCELGSPNQLIRAGWKKEDLPVGTRILITGNPARKGGNTCSTSNVKLEDGTVIFTRFGNK